MAIQAERGAVAGDPTGSWKACPGCTLPAVGRGRQKGLEFKVTLATGESEACVEPETLFQSKETRTKSKTETKEQALDDLTSTHQAPPVNGSITGH